MDDQLKKLMQELGNAINESLRDSERIAAACGEIKQAGYDVFLVLEATIGFNKRDEDADDDDMPEAGDSGSFEFTGPVDKVSFTTQDHKFLKALKIAVDEEA